MKLPEFMTGMKAHFGITNGVNKFIDGLLTTPDNIMFDIVAFDDWLHDRFGNYENYDEDGNGLSVSEFIKMQFGNEAEAFIERCLK